MNFLITDKQQGQRLDVALARLSGQARSQVQHWLKDGLVSLNGQPAKANQRLKSGDCLTVVKRRWLKEQQLVPEVVAETADYVVLNKPAGLIVHAGGASQEPTLVDWLTRRYPQISKVGENKLRPGLVHRLDKEVSGLLVVAKTPAAFSALKRQFQERTVSKCYQALVYGAVSQTSGEINFSLARSHSKGKMAARPAGSEGRAALTEFRVLKKFINFTYLELTLITGRTHQLRAHLAAFNHPLVGDNLYSTKSTRVKNKQFNLGRVWLVASYLSFEDLQGEKQEFKLKLPPELEEVLKKVR